MERTADPVQGRLDCESAEPTEQPSRPEAATAHLVLVKPSLAPSAKLCPKCSNLVQADASQCECGFVFPSRSARTEDSLHMTRPSFDWSWLGLLIPASAVLFSLFMLAITPHQEGEWLPRWLYIGLRLIHIASAFGLVLSIAALRRRPAIRASDSIGARFNVAAAGFGVAVNAVLFLILFAAW